MSGLGAWWHMWAKGDDGRSDPSGRFACGILGWKSELIYNGFWGNIVSTLPFFGDAMVTQVKAFQTSVGAHVDGVIGPETGKYLLLKHKRDVQNSFQIPDDWLAKMAHWESNDDIVAQGWMDENDEGCYQVNGPSHPELSKKQRWSPAFIILWAGRAFVSNYNAVGKDWEGAVAAWNLGNWRAEAWVAAGKPETGGPDGIYTRCYQYVRRVAASAP